MGEDAEQLSSGEGALEGENHNYSCLLPQPGQVPPSPGRSGESHGCDFAKLQLPAGPSVAQEQTYFCSTASLSDPERQESVPAYGSQKDQSNAL